jgi:CheY-like chemotaxis protein
MPGEPTVLIVEDHLDSAEMLKCFLRHAGIRAVCAHDVPNALLRARWRRPAVALVDLSLPSFGHACVLVRRLSAYADAPYIIGLNGFGFQSYEGAAFAAGCSAVLRKPFDLQDVLNAIDSGVGSRRAG